jgi:hypothetical protein
LMPAILASPRCIRARGRQSPLPHGADSRSVQPHTSLFRPIPNGKQSCHHQSGGRIGTDSQTGILATEVSSAMCVQRLDDSQVCADRITFRISLRSSSLQEPRDPLLKVVCCSHTCFLSHLHTCAEHSNTAANATAHRYRHV